MFCSQFLKFTSDNGYELYLLGKNGEPKPGVDVNINFTIKYVNSEKTVTLTTNADGKVILGHLPNIISINSSVRNVGDVCADQS